MKSAFTTFSFIVTLLLIAGCASRIISYLYNPGKGYHSSYKVGEEQVTILEKADSSVQTSVVASDYTLPPEPLMVASDGAAAMAATSVFPQKVKTSDLKVPDRPFGNKAGLKKETQAFKAAQKYQKKLAPPEEGKGVNKLTIAGFILSLLSVLSLYFLIFIETPGLLVFTFLLGFFSAIAGILTSLKGIGQIRRNPDRFTGKGAGWAGVIISSLLFILFSAFILFILAYGAN